MPPISFLSLFTPLTIKKGLFLAFVVLIFVSFASFFISQSRKHQQEKQCNLHTEKSFSIEDQHPKTAFSKNCYYITNSSEITYRQLSDAHFYGASTIPRIIHRTWKDNSGFVLQRWLEADHSENGDYYICVWTDRDMDEFIAAEYSIYHPIYLNYEYFNQRTSAARYFIINRFGGIYLDIELDFDFRIDRFLKHYSDFDVILTLSNGRLDSDVIISKPRQSFWRHVIDNLDDSSKWYGLIHETVSYSTGSMHLTKCQSSFTSAEQQQHSDSVIALIPFNLLLSLLSGPEAKVSPLIWRNDANAFSFARWFIVICPLFLSCLLVIIFVYQELKD